MIRVTEAKRTERVAPRQLGRAAAAITAAAAVAALVATALGSSSEAAAIDSRGMVPTGVPGITPTATTAVRSGKAKVRLPLRATGILRWGNTYSAASGYDRYQYVFVGREDARLAARLPGTSLVYMSGLSVQREWSTGVSFNEAEANDWLLRDSQGNFLRHPYSGAYIGDVGSRDYQIRFATNVAQFLRRTGVDGVFIDDVSTGGFSPARYPTYDSWKRAQLDFVSNVTSLIKARGDYYVLVNADDFVPNDPRTNTGENNVAFFRQLAGLGVDGIMCEYWLQNPHEHTQLRSIGSENWWENWSGWHSLLAVTQKAGADFFGLMYGSGSDLRAMRYGRANFLLDWNWRGGAFLYDMTDRPDPHHPLWVTQLGRPLAPRFERLPGVWQRSYERGLVIVNTTKDVIQVKVTGATRTIASTDALLLRVP